eukprot:scaffold8640_cov135-Skeletonema_marinoi.AAC.1
MLLYYRNNSRWAPKSFQLLHSQRRIRYGAREMLAAWRPSQMYSSGHLRRCSDADTTYKCLSRGKDASILSRPTIMGH